MSTLMPLPRLAIRRRHISVLVSVSATNREFQLRPYWVVLLVDPAKGGEEVVYHGRDEGIYGWVDCVDYAKATVAQAKAKRL